jgi:hypothetical protein
LSVQALIRAAAIASLLLLGPFALYYLRRHIGMQAPTRPRTEDA